MPAAFLMVLFRHSREEDLDVVVQVGGAGGQLGGQRHLDAAVAQPLTQPTRHQHERRLCIRQTGPQYTGAQKGGQAPTSCRHRGSSKPSPPPIYHTTIIMPASQLLLTAHLLLPERLQLEVSGRGGVEHLSNGHGRRPPLQRVLALLRVQQQVLGSA